MQQEARYLWSRVSAVAAVMLTRLGICEGWTAGKSAEEITLARDYHDGKDSSTGSSAPRFGWTW